MYKRKLTDEVIEMFDVGYDIYTDCLTFPCNDEKGNCLFVTRRHTKTKFFHIPTGVEKPVYGLDKITSDMKEVVVCEYNKCFDTLDLGNTSSCSIRNRNKFPI